jgi:hypothetical protein
MSDLMQKLAISKAIMDKHNTMGRGNAPQPTNIQSPMVENYDAPAANFNIPSEFVSESNIPSVTSELPPKDRILNSKLPDEIKRLMIENPIQTVNPLSASNTSVLSDELIEKASKLMGTKKPQVSQTSTQGQNVSGSVSDNNLRQIMKEVVQEVLKENGLITESTSKSDEVMMIKVGKHIFEGKISKVKKLK